MTNLNEKMTKSTLTFSHSNLLRTKVKLGKRNVNRKCLKIKGKSYTKIGGMDSSRTQGGITPVHGDDGTVHELGSVRCQERDERGDVVDLADSTDRM